MSSCIFCEIIKGNLPSTKIYEDEKTIAFLDKFPLAEGHTLIIPKNHSETLYEISETDSEAVGATVSKVVKIVKKVLKCDGVNVYQANEKAAMQEIMHVHFHVIPRFKNDGIKLIANRSSLDVNSEIIPQLKEGFKDL
ncbi:MAG: HIT family protein [Candidatus Hodarchaeales archaeon]|jgi:histidine triad (HIT) family protein